MLLLVAASAFVLTGPRLSRDGGFVHPRAIASHTAAAKLPLAAEGAVSRVLGRDDPSYRAARAGGGFALNNSRQRLGALFNSGGVLIRSGRAWLGLSVRGYGYGDDLNAVDIVQPAARANRVNYRRESFDEWYANGPLGLEQGFTLASPPVGRRAGALTLALALSGNVRASLTRGADAVTFSGRGVSLAYRGLIATDARGRPLRARIELRRGVMMLRIDARDARYPLRIDPFVQQAKLTASDGAGGDDFGFSVAVSGNAVVVGAPRATVGNQSQQGAAYVFVEPVGGWANATEAAKLAASDGSAGYLFGYSVAISGNTIVVGTGCNCLGTAGVAYVFVEPAGGWGSGTQPQHEAARLTASDGAAHDNFGSSVAIDGNTIVAGAPGATVGGNSGQGAAYVFVEPAGGWGSGSQPQHEAAKLTASDGAAVDNLGWSVAIAGTTIVAGAPAGNANNPQDEAAYVFVEPPGAGWGSGPQPQHETAKLTPSDASSVSWFASSVALDGSTVVAGAPGPAAYVFVEPPTGGWVSENERARLTASNGDSLGAVETTGVTASVAISGNTIVAGAPEPGGFATDQGAAYVFVEPTGGWASEAESAKLTASDGYGGDTFGWSVAIAGNTIVAGANNGIADSVPPSGPSPGAAYVFGGFATSFALSCSPTTVFVGQQTACIAAVTDTANGGQATPSGTISFSSDSPGGFGPTTSCTLSGTGASASCQVTYTPSAIGSGTHTITAKYGGDGSHSATSTSTRVSVSGQPPEPTAVMAKSGDGEAAVSWQETAPAGAVTGFNIQVVTASGVSFSSVVANAGPGTSSTKVTGLTDCDPYQFEVQATGPAGDSAWSSPSNVIVPHWTPSGAPQVAVILMEGVDSVSPQQTYNPVPGSGSYCYYSDGGGKTSFQFGLTSHIQSSLTSLMNNFNSAPDPYSNVLASMTDRLAAHGRVVFLPWSFNGVWVDASHRIHVDRSTAADADQIPIATDARTLKTEIAYVHALWPKTRIIVLAHSLGGLVAEQYWEDYWRGNHQGVSRIIALDAPLNGTKTIGLCGWFVGSPGACPAFSYAVANFMASLWTSMDWHDPAIAANDTNGAFLPVGTEGDEAYAIPNLGTDSLISQLLFTCHGGFLQPETCSAISPGFVSPCPSSDHGEVKACSGVIDYVENAVFPVSAAQDATRDLASAAHGSDLLGLGNLGLHVRVPLDRVIAGKPWARPTAPTVARGGTLTLEGAGLGSTPGSVQMSGIPATVTAWSSGAVTVHVPAGGRTGDLVVATAAGGPVPVPGVVVLPGANGVDRLLAPKLITLAVGTQLRLVVRAFRHGRPAPGATVSVFDGGKERSVPTHANGAATFVFTPSLTSRLVVFSGTTWRTVEIKWAAPPVTAIELVVRSRRPGREHTLRVVATVRGPHGLARDVPVAVVVSGAHGGGETKNLRTNQAGLISLKIKVHPGETVTATSYGTSAELIIALRGRRAKRRVTSGAQAR